eukprot:592766-Rhodomonas_salina.1
MRAANQHVTLDEQAPSLAKTDIWDPSLASMSLEQNYAPPVDVDDAELGISDGWSSTEGGSAMMDVNDPPTPP